MPGQWVDTFIPGLEKAGGFTITSVPSQATPTSHSAPFLELAVCHCTCACHIMVLIILQIQASSNPPARWLSQPEDQVLGKQIVVRVGGSFTWPPQTLDASRIDRLVLVAAGVGINPLISIFSHLIRGRTRPKEIHFLYASKTDSELDPQRILFLPRLMDLVGAVEDPNVTLRLFLTGTGDQGPIEHGKFPNRTFARRFQEQDLTKAINGYREQGSDLDSTVCYVCGPPRMSDETVAFLQDQPGMANERVLCEKWW